MKLNKFNKKFKLKTKKVSEENPDELKPIDDGDEFHQAADSKLPKMKGKKNKRKFSEAFATEENAQKTGKKKSKKVKPKNEVDTTTSTENTDEKPVQNKKNKKKRKKKQKSSPIDNNISLEIDEKNISNGETVENIEQKSTDNDVNISKKEKKKVKFHSGSEVSQEGEKPKNATEPVEKSLQLPGEIKDSRDSRTIFVGNLPINFDKKKLTKMFSTCGEIEKLWTRGVIPDNEKISKKVAFAKKLFHKDQLSLVAYILYKTAEEANKALSLNGEVFDEHHLRVSISNDKSFDKNKGIFLGNLPFNVTDDEIWDFFKDCGEIASVRIVRDSSTGLGKGFGYVNFKSVDAVELALKLNEEELQGRQIRINRLFSEGKQKKLKKKKLLNKPTDNKFSKFKPNKKDKSEKANQDDKKSNTKFKKKKTSKTDLKKKQLAEKLLSKPKKKKDAVNVE